MRLNTDLSYRQVSLFNDVDNNDMQVSNNLQKSLNKLCPDFNKKQCNIHHVLVVFDYYGGNIQLLKAYLLTNLMDVIEEDDWLETVNPILSNEVPEAMDGSAFEASNVMLNKNSFDRISNKSKNGDQGNANQNTNAGSKKKNGSSKTLNTTS